MHVFLPPHPGPIAASEFYGANIGQLLILGLPVTLITWYFSGYLLGKILGAAFMCPFLICSAAVRKITTNRKRLQRHLRSLALC